MQPIMAVTCLPPRLSAISRVSLDSRVGTCWICFSTTKTNSSKTTLESCAYMSSLLGKGHNDAAEHEQGLVESSGSGLVGSGLGHIFRAGQVDQMQPPRANQLAVRSSLIKKKKRMSGTRCARVCVMILTSLVWTVTVKMQCEREEEALSLVAAAVRRALLWRRILKMDSTLVTGTDSRL